MAILNAGPSSSSLGSLRICRLALATPQSSHSTVLIPLILAPFEQLTRCGPGCPSLRWHIRASALFGGFSVHELNLFRLVWNAVGVVSSGMSSITYWSNQSTNSQRTELSLRRRVFCPGRVSHHIARFRN